MPGARCTHGPHLCAFLGESARMGGVRLRCQALILETSLAAELELAGAPACAYRRASDRHTRDHLNTLSTRVKLSHRLLSGVTGLYIPFNPRGRPPAHRNWASPRKAAQHALTRRGIRLSYRSALCLAEDPLCRHENSSSHGAVTGQRCRDTAMYRFNAMFRSTEWARPGDFRSDRAGVSC